MMKLYSQARPDTAVPSARLKLKPDHALFSISLSVSDLAAQPALTLLSTWATRVEKEVTQVASEASVVPVDFEPPALTGLLSKSGEDVAARLVLMLKLPLSIQSAPIVRAQRVAAVDDVLRSLVVESRKSKPSVALSRATPTYLVNDDALTQARKQLVTKWLERLEELSSVSAVTVENATPTIDVFQRALTLEEVEIAYEPGGTVRFRVQKKGTQASSGSSGS